MMPHYTEDLTEVIAGLKKASKLHAAQAKKLEKIKKDQSQRYKKKPAAKKKNG
tara:strand:- start:971 stop:1129 length:159 start_codon:yes stop_codon:yes gene_type:complete